MAGGLPKVVSNWAGLMLGAGDHTAAQVLEEAEGLHGARRHNTVEQSSVDSCAHSLTKSPAKSHLPSSPSLPGPPSSLQVLVDDGAKINQ